MQVSPVRPEILWTNSAPSPEECNFIRNSFIPFHVEKCLALDDRILSAQAALAALRSEQQTHYDLIHAHKVVLAPIRRLVPDILLEIFRHCHSQFVEAPIRLARVCRKWRELVLSTPTLWTIVSLHDSMPAQRIVPFARACVAYSGSCPIKVVLKFMHRPRGPTMRQALFEALAILACHVHRWQAFEFFMDDKWQPDDILNALRGNGPLIERMVIKVNDVHSIPFRYLPKLRDLILSAVHRQDIPIILQYTQLRTLSICWTSGLTLMDCWTILSNCSEIEVFHIANVHSDITVLPEGEITLPHLRDLRIGPFTPDPAPLIHRIKAPVLQQLQMMIRNRGIDSSCVRRLVQECRPPLTTLALVYVDGEDVAGCLPLLPELKSLSLQHTHPMDIVITRLTEQDGDGRFSNCPILEHFGLRLCEFTGEHMVHMLRERERAAGGLRVLLTGNPVYKPGEFVGLTAELFLVEGFTDLQLKELPVQDMETDDPNYEAWFCQVEVMSRDEL